MSGVGDEAEVRFVIFVQWRGHADNNGVHGGELRIVGGGREAMRLGGLDFVRRDAVDVGGALGQGFDLASINVEAGDLEFLFAVQQRQRKTDVAEADDADAGLVLLNFGFELIDRGIGRGGSRHEYSGMKLKQAPKNYLILARRRMASSR